MKFIEFKTTKNPDDIKWEDCVVWKNGEDYSYIESTEIRYVSWSFGIVSIIPHRTQYFQNILIQY